MTDQGKLNVLPKIEAKVDDAPNNESSLNDLIKNLKIIEDEVQLAKQTKSNIEEQTIKAKEKKDVLTKELSDLKLKKDKLFEDVRYDLIIDITTFHDLFKKG